MSIWFIALAVFFLNIPFGYWRANVKKFSLQWILAVHSPVPFVIVLRLVSGLGFEFITFPILVAAFFTGQYFGGIIQSLLKKRVGFENTSCLVLDLVRIKESNERRKG